MQALDAHFDHRHGVDTAGIISLGYLSIASKNCSFGYSYEPTHWIDFEEILERFNIEYEHYILIELGPGKGKVLLLASHLAFKKIIGIEFSRELHEIAERNVASYRSDRQRLGELSMWPRCPFPEVRPYKGT